MSNADEFRPRDHAEEVAVVTTREE